MSAEMAVSLALKLNDQGSGPATQALGKINRAMKEMESVAKSTSTAAVSAFQKLASAREILGVRSEKAIQNEIRQTEAAYQRMATTGQASARELGRAQDAMRQKVAGLRQEMEGVKHSASGMPAAMKVAMGAFGAYQAGKMVVQGPVGQTMAYDRSLANLSNTAFAGQSMDARRGGMRTLDAAIVAAVRSGGGTREGALGTLDKLVASGAYEDVGEALKLLPTLTRAATGGNADPAHLADIAIRAKQTFGITDAGLAIDQAMKAGQMGGFELKDMAKWLPQQMAMGRMSGLKGDSGYRTLLALNQAAVITASTKDEAGNNVVNLLGKINSQDTAKDFEKIKINGKGIDLPGSLAAARAKGINSVDAFSGLVEQVLSQDKNYVALRKKAASATGDEQKATYESMADIAMGKGMGKTTQDRQALMGLIAAMQFRGVRDKVYTGTDASKARGTFDDALGLVAETPSFKAEQLAAEKAIAMQVALDKVNPALGSFAEGLTGVMREWPAFSAGIVGASTALFALAAAAGAAALPGLLSGGGAAGAGAAARGALGRGGMALGAAGVAAAPLGLMWGVSEWADSTAQPGEAEKVVSRMQSSPLSKMLGYLGLNRDGDIEARRAKNREGLDTTGQPQKVEVVVKVENGNIVAAVNEVNARNSVRH